jgi:putative membrane protein
MRLSISSLLGVAGVLMAATPGIVSAHTGGVSASTWSARGAVAVALLTGTWLYARGLRRLGTRWRRKRTVAAAAGAGVMSVALLYPLDTLAATSVTAHMAQHTLLIVVAAPLLALGRPVAVLAAAVPWSPRAGRLVGTPRPGVWSMAHAVALWLWHLPPLYDVTLTDPIVHAVAHASLFGTAALLWWSVTRGRARVIGALWLFVTAFHAGGLGALLALSTRPWFRAATLEDQQLAGLLMWVPAGIILTGIALALLAGWLRSGGRRASLVAALVATVLAASGSGGCNQAGSTAAAMTGGDAMRGRDTMRTYGCATCHTIPGVDGAIGSVGPPLTQVARRSYVAGAPNTPDRLVQFLRHPRRVRPGTPMPELGVTERDARDIAAYLYTLR